MNIRTESAIVLAELVYQTQQGFAMGEGWSDYFGLDSHCRTALTLMVTIQWASMAHSCSARVPYETLLDADGHQLSDIRRFWKSTVERFGGP